MPSTITHEEVLVSIGMAATVADVGDSLLQGTLVWFENARTRVNADVFDGAPTAVANAALTAYFGMQCAMTSGRESCWARSGAEAMLSTYADLPGGFLGE